MLHPIFFARVVQLDKGVAIAQDPLPPGYEYPIVGYSQAENYTLVKWRLGTSEDYVSGETLWEDFQPIATGVGEIPLESLVDLEGDLFLNQIESQKESVKIPTNVATLLRDPVNIVLFV